MARTNNRNKSQMNTGLLVKLGLGVSPIPIVGDVALSWGFYDLLKSSEQNAISPIAGIPAALLTRWGLYTEIYIPIARQLGLIY